LLLPGGNSDSSAAVLKLLGTQSINIRFINKYKDSAGNTSLCICIDAEFLDAALNLLDVNEKSLGVRDFMYHPRVKVISIYPHKERPRIAERLLTTLRMNGIYILSVNNASSVIKMWRMRSPVWEMPLSYHKPAANDLKSLTEEPSCRQGKHPWESPRP